MLIERSDPLLRPEPNMPPVAIEAAFTRGGRAAYVRGARGEEGAASSEEASKDCSGSYERFFAFCPVAYVEGCGSSAGGATVA